MNKAQEMFDCSFTRPYAEDGYTLNDYVDRLLKDVSWNLWHRQEEMCYMITEKNPPMLKENAIDIMREVIRPKFSWIMNYIICRILIEYRMGNIDLGDEAEFYLREQFDDEEWKDLNEAINKHIWNEYSKNLGIEQAKEYFIRIGHPEYIKEEDIE